MKYRVEVVATITYHRTVDAPNQRDAKSIAVEEFDPENPEYVRLTMDFSEHTNLEVYDVVKR